MGFDLYETNILMGLEIKSSNPIDWINLSAVVLRTFFYQNQRL
jgi:hypothetical protein